MEDKQIIISWTEIARRVIKPLQIKAWFFAILMTGTMFYVLTCKNSLISFSLMGLVLIFCLLFVYYKKSIDKVKKEIYNYGAGEVYEKYYPEEYKQMFGEKPMENSLYERPSKIKSRLTQIEEIAKKYQNE